MASMNDNMLCSCPAPTMLTVNEVERLAKAGVQIKFEDIADRVSSDPTLVAHGTYQRSNHLVHLFRERLMNRERVKQSHNPDWQMTVYMPDCWAAAYKEKVYLFIAPGNAEPLILEDAANMYPSDALMAKYDLLQKTLREIGDYKPMDMGAEQAGMVPAPQQSPPRPQSGGLGGAYRKV